MNIKCFKCRAEIKPAWRDARSPWESPSGAVKFRGGSNFGSTIYDSLTDGIHVEIVICDPCLKEAQNDRLLLREITIERSQPIIKEVVRDPGGDGPSA